MFVSKATQNIFGSSWGKCCHMKHRNSLFILILLTTILSACKDDSSPSPNPGNSDEQIRADYEANIVGTALSDLGWTGSTISCTAGKISDDAQSKTLQRINYVRLLAGLPGDISFNPEWNAKCQEAALMCYANGQLNHSPPSSWKCYTADGREGASRSNLSSASGPGAILSYMRDAGANNTSVGHRRYILSSRAKTMGHGSCSRYDALWVVGGSQTNPNPPEFIAWPPKNVPAPLVYPRWSCGFPGADVSSATVEVRDESGALITAPIVSQNTSFADPTVVFEPQGIVLTENGKTYSVTIKNVIRGGESKDYSYDVRIVTID